MVSIQANRIVILKMQEGKPFQEAESSTVRNETSLWS